MKKHKIVSVPKAVERPKTEPFKNGKRIATYSGYVFAYRDERKVDYQVEPDAVQ